MKDYYSILGISDEEKNLPWDKFEKICTKKFRSLSKKWHPDKWVNGTEEEKKIAEDKFKEINEANEILSNKEKKQQYDYGDSDEINWPNFDRFKDFFKKRNVIKKGNDIKITVSITLENSYIGGETSCSILKHVKCPTCNGSGLGKNTKKETCKVCHGSGIKVNMYKSGYTVYQEETICPACDGVGYKLIDPCDECKGSGLISKNEIIKIPIPKGIFNGMTYKMSLMGDECPEDGINGDLYVTYTILPNNNFIRNGNDLISIKNIPIVDALLGTNIEVETINHKKLKFKIDPLTENGKTFKLNGKGMPYLNTSNQYGNMIVQINYELPNNLTDEQKELLVKFKEIENNK